MPARLLLAAVATLVSMLVGEAWLRLAGPPAAVASGRRFDGLLGWSDAEYAAFEPAGPAADDQRVRLLVLGDSYLADGYRLPDGGDGRFPAALERRHPRGLVTAVLSSRGWGTDQQLLAFLDKGVAWCPDRVLLAVCLNNDLCDVLANTHDGRPVKPFAVAAPDGTLTWHHIDGSPMGDPRAAVAAARRRGSSRLAAALSRWWTGPERAPTTTSAPERFRRHPGREHLVTREIIARAPRLELAPQQLLHSSLAWQVDEHPVNRAGWSQFEAVLGALDAAVTAAGARLTVLVLPMTYAPGDLAFTTGAGRTYEYATPAGPLRLSTEAGRQRLAAVCGRLGVEHIDPCDGWYAAARDQDLTAALWRRPDDRHWSVIGHHLLLPALETWLSTWPTAVPSPR